jgi:small subunit ribosomal protein S18
LRCAVSALLPPKEIPMAVSTAKKKRRYSRPKRVLDPQIVFDYKDIQLLRRFVTEHGKIVPRRISGASAQQQRALTVAVKRARMMALLAYGPTNDPR